MKRWMNPRVLVLVLPVIACTTTHQHAIELGPHKGPIVVASSAICGEGQGNLAVMVGHDAKRLKTLLRAEVVLADGSTGQGIPTESALKRAIVTSEEDRGLFVIYSGHGSLSKDGSNVCLYSEDGSRGALLPAKSLVLPSPPGDGNAASPPWALVLLNSCESAFVDLRGAKRPTAVISTAHKEVTASLQGSSMGAEGTVVTTLLANILSGNDESTARDDQPGGPDANCDGILTDYELFGRLVTELARVYPDTGTNPPVFNLRRSSRTHIPLPLDGVPRPSKACKPDTVRAGIQGFLASVQGSEPTTLELKEELSKQMRLADELQISAPVHRPMAYPKASRDYFIVDPPDPELAQKIQDSGLAPFPGGRAEAELVADYAIFAEVYLFAPDGPDRVRVLSLRRPPVPFNDEKRAGLRLLRNLTRADMAIFVRGLARRAMVIGEHDGGKLELLVTDQVGTETFDVETPKRKVQIDPRRLHLVPCEEGEGQCFEYTP